MESMVEHRKENSIKKKQQHRLYDKWTLWAHLPHDTDWSLSSYHKIITLETIEESLVLFETFPEVMIKNCMLFLMRDGINPTWEDTNYGHGGCFSFKIYRKFIRDIVNGKIKTNEIKIIANDMNKYVVKKDTGMWYA